MKIVKWLVSFSIVVFSLGLLSPVSTYAQVSGATLSGTVTDQSGSAVPNAQITVTNVGKTDQSACYHGFRWVLYGTKSNARDL